MDGIAIKDHSLTVSWPLQLNSLKEFPNLIFQEVILAFEIFCALLLGSQTSYYIKPGHSPIMEQPGLEKNNNNKDIAIE